MATDRPRSRLQAARIVGEDQLLQGEGEGVAGGEPPGALRLYARDQVRPHIKECVAGSAAHPFEAATDERVAVHRRHVERHATAGLVAVDQAQGPRGVGRVGDRADVLQVAGRVEEVGRRDQGGSGVDPLRERLGRDRHAVRRRHEIHLEPGAREPLVAHGREVEPADHDLVPPGQQGQARGQGRQGD